MRSKNRKKKRIVSLESLEVRTLLAADLAFLQNPIEPLDVNDDGEITPGDVLMAVNEMNAGVRSGGGRAGFFDVNGDRQLTPLDPLTLINHMNRSQVPGGPPQGGRTPAPEPTLPPRTFDGTGNNLRQPEWGSSDEQLLRLAPADYGDGISAPAGADRPSARAISNAVADQSEGSLPNERFLSDFIYVWGQFLDHDIDLTDSATPAEPFNISVPTGDAFFDSSGTGTQVIRLNRSEFDPTTGTGTDNPREQINQITAWIDGSVVYGSDAERAAALRTFEGGKLKTSTGDLLPFNTLGLPNANDAHRVPDDQLFLAGDVRANENIELTSIQVLFLREHNRIAEEIASARPGLSDEEIYQQARRQVVAEIQAVTYNEFLPALLGPQGLRPYNGYHPDVNPGIANEFSTAAYRFGHSLLADDVEFLDNDGQPVRDEVPLSEAFFNPQLVVETGIDPIIKYLATDSAQEVDTQLVDSVRNFLFGPPGAGGLDLAALNIQRGRDHGLADYNSTRQSYGLPRVESFREITSDETLQQTLEDLYGDVDNIDLWVGGLAEDHVPGSSVGPTVQRILVDQFTRLRDGDRYWYQNALSGQELHAVETTKLSEIIRRNTGITNLQDNVFFEPSVLYFEASAGRRGADLAVAVQEDTLELIDQRTHQVIESRLLDEVSQVIIVGSPGEDRILIDLGSSQPALSGGVIIQGQRGLDEVIIRGTPDVDTILVDRHAVTVNETNVQLASVESLRIDTGAGEDDVQIADRPAFRVTVDGDAGPRGPGRHAAPPTAPIPPSGAQPAPPASTSVPRGEGGSRCAEPADGTRSRQTVFAGIADTGNVNATIAGSELGKKSKPAGSSDTRHDDPGHLARDLAFANLELGNVV